MSTSLQCIPFHFKQLTLPVQDCFNRCLIGTHSLAHTLKSNNPDQFNHKAVAGEGKQPFPLWPKPGGSANTKAAHFSSPFELCICVSGLREYVVQEHSAASCSVMVKCHWLNSVSLQTNTHLWRGQSAVEATSCSLELLWVLQCCVTFLTKHFQHCSWS